MTGLEARGLAAATAMYEDYLAQMKAVGHPLSREVVAGRIVKAYLAALAPVSGQPEGWVAIPSQWFEVLGDQAKRNTAEWWSALESLQQARTDRLAAPSHPATGKGE